ncbi:hypothetical protein G6F65_020742 [Rhizopus arrhizus]|nr:hypothetical protein G6F65_020742 [Rhizopus arrhizus]
MCRGVAVVGDQSLTCGLERQVHRGLLLAPALERVLPVGKGQPRVGPGIRGVQPHRHLEKMPRQRVVRLVEPVHVPQAAVMGRPRVQRIRRRENGPVALGGFDLDFDRRDDPVADLVQCDECVVQRMVEGLCPHDARRPRFDERHVHDDPLGVPAQRAAHHEVHIQRRIPSPAR